MLKAAEISWVPMFHLFLEKRDIDLLACAAGAHYDSRCKKAALPGGFIFGWRNAFILAEGEPAPDYPMRATRDELDTLLKILEMRSMVFGAEDLKVVDQIARAALQVMINANPRPAERQVVF